MIKKRPNSVAFCGGAFGDEGKGRIVDEYVSLMSKKRPVVIYRDNGGANAGHTVVFGSHKIALHQLPSGVVHENASVVLGKGMVIHPADLVSELKEVQLVCGTVPGTVYIDQDAVASLDTHRAFETALKNWQDGGKGATGRGIAPAYADVVLRHPLRMRDLHKNKIEKIKAHYRLYNALIKGLGESLQHMHVASLSGSQQLVVGSESEFIDRILSAMNILQPHLIDGIAYMKQMWSNISVGFVFEKAQAIGLDARWGVYPDVTASDTTFDGIFSSTTGIVDPKTIASRLAVIKATYMSSVGTRRLPTRMPEPLAHKIREDAWEYGATTKRPRDIVYLDIPALKFYAKVGSVTGYILTHMDVSYTDTPVRVCISYELHGKKIDYRPDQEFLSLVKPIYKDLKGWSGDEIRKADNIRQLPKYAKSFLIFIEKQLQLPIVAITTGPKRSQTLFLK